MRLSFWHRQNKGLLVITLVYAIFLAVMMPLHNKAYLDDFAYIQSVKRLVVEGNFQISDWSAVSFTAQLFWGAIFSYIFGFSSVTLQTSTMVLFYFGLIAFYFTLKEFEIGDFGAAIFILAFLGFPWIPLLTVSFMTDIPYLSVFMISLFFYFLGIKSVRKTYGGGKYLLLGSVFASLTFLVRQTGVILPVSAFLVLIYDLKNRKRFSNCFYALTLPAVTAAVYFIWSKDHPTFSQIYAMRHILWPTVNNLPQIFFRIVFYLANIFIFIWPVFLVFVSKNILKKASLPKNIFAMAGIFAFFLTAAILVSNYFSDSAAQMLPLKETFASNYSYFLKVIPENVLKNLYLLNAFFTVLTLSLSLILFKDSVRAAGKILFQGAPLFLFLSFLFQFAFILILPFAWAEYSLILLPFALIGLALASRQLPINRLAASIILSILIIISVFNAKVTHEALGTVWERAEKLVRSGVSPGVIDTGSYAWYPWWYYEETFAAALLKVNGDKNKLQSLQTWDFPKEADYQYKLSF